MLSYLERRVTVLHQYAHVRFRQFDWQHAILEAVVVENVREARANEAFYPEVEDRPRCMLPATGRRERQGERDVDINMQSRVAVSLRSS